MKIRTALKYGVLIIITFLTSCISLDPTFTDEESYFSEIAKTNDKGIYSGEPSEGFLQVFAFRSHVQDPFWLTGLALTQFSGDSIYNSIELQKVESQEEGAMIVLLYHADKSLVDAYHPKNLPLLKSELEKMINHAEMHPSQFVASFSLDFAGYSMRLNMTDKYGRNIFLDIKEEKPSGDLVKLIAPVGSGINNPQYFPLLYLDDMRLVSKKGSTYSLTIGDSKMKLSKIPFTPYYMTRYCFTISNAEWLPQSDKIIRIEESGNSDEVTNSYIINNGYKELLGQQFDFHGNKLNINYCPPVPDIPALNENRQFKGRFCVNAGFVEGVMAGIYLINKINGTIIIKVVPEEGWQPFPGRPWMTTYEWEAELSQLADKSFHMKSGWVRKK